MEHVDYLIFFLAVAFFTAIIIFFFNFRFSPGEILKKLISNCLVGGVLAVLTVIFGPAMGISFLINFMAAVVLILGGFPGYVLLLIYFNFFN